MDANREKIIDALAALFQGKRDAGAAFSENDGYDAFLARFAPDENELARQRQKRAGARALIVISGGGRQASRATIDSIAAQTYQNYEITDDPLTTEGDFVLRLSAGDILREDALYHFARAMEGKNGPELVYSDEDVLVGGVRSHPLFKPDYCEATALSYDLFGGASACSKRLYAACCAPGAGRAGDAPGESFAFALRCLARAADARHIPLPLISLGKKREDIPFSAGAGAISYFLGQTGRNARISEGIFPSGFRVGSKAWPPETAIIIPNRDDTDSLRACLESIEECCRLFEPRIIIVDGGSISARTLKYYDILEKNRAARIVRHGEGGFACLCNAGARAAGGTDAFLFFSRDARMTSPQLLPSMAEQAMRRGAGAIGALVTDEAGRVLSSGNVAGLGGTIASPYAGFPFEGLSGRLPNAYIRSVRGALAVCGACMYIRSEVFFSSGGFDESFSDLALLPIGADVELCVRLMRRGLTNIYTPFAKAKLTAPLPSVESGGEKARTRLYDALRPAIAHGDPYFNSNLSKKSTWLRPKVSGEDEPLDAF